METKERPSGAGRTLDVPELSVVVLMGATSAGKSTFASRHFLETEVVSSDRCRAWVTDDPNAMDANDDAFALVHQLLETRLRRRRLTVIDATNVKHDARKPLVEIARRQGALVTAIVLDLPEEVLLERNAARPDRKLPAGVVRRHQRDLRRSVRHLRREGFHRVHVLSTLDEVENASIRRVPLWNDRRELTGPFDIIGDVHGCFDELVALMEAMGYGVARGEDPIRRWEVTAPEGRTAVFVGDLVDRGPASPDALALAMGMVERGQALCVSGNHEAKLSRALSGRKVTPKHGLAETLEQLDAETPEFREAVSDFVNGLVSHYMLAGGDLCVAHAGLSEALQGRASGAVRAFALYGDVTGEKDEAGLPIRRDWARSYRGKTTVVYGHTPVERATWVQNTMCVDTGCVFGGSLTALRWPEGEVVSVPAKQVYAELGRPMRAASAPAREGDLLLSDVTGERRIETSLIPMIKLKAPESAAALEVLSRHAVDPRWLIHLPPTMSPPETTSRDGLLEHPDEALSYYASQGVEKLVCEAKHMGSRAVAIVLKEDAVATSRFGLEEPAPGMVTTRTGRRFFNDPELERALLEGARAACESAGLFTELETDWVCLDCELMPWSAKARELLRRQYAPVGAASRATLSAASDALARAAARGVDVGALTERTGARLEAAQAFTRAYRQYCWDTEGMSGLRLAPFHVLAAEGATFHDRDHLWHMDWSRRLAEADPGELMMATPFIEVDTSDESSMAATVAWWEELCDGGGEGMVVKPLEYIRHNERGRLMQPAIKCRGPEYLRIIYGAEYLLEGNLKRLRKRGVNRKRGLAVRELALGLDALDRFVAKRPLNEVHARVAGVLALESDPVDPRL